MKIRTETRRSIRWLAHLAGVALLVAAAYTAAQPQTTEAIVVEQSPSLITFIGGTAKAAGRLKIRIDGPNGQTVYESVSEAGLLDWVPEANLPDGRYSWDAWFVPQSALGRSHEKDAVKGVNEATSDYRSGSFHLEGGSLVMPENPSVGEQASLSWPERALGAVLNSIVPTAAAQHSNFATISDDDGDDGTFLSMANANNSSAGICNEDGNLELFVDGVCLGGNQEMLIQENAPTNSIFVESTGDVGLGTSTPNNPLHIVDTNPLIQYERTGSNSWVTGPIGSSAELFLIGSTTLGAEFFLHRDAPGGSLQIDENGNVGMGTSPESELHILDTDFTAQLTLEGPAGRHKLSSTSGNDLTMGEGGGVPAQFILRGGAPSGSLVVNDSGNLGVGTSSPDKQLHVQGSDTNQLGQNNVMLQVENTVGDQGPRRMMELINNGSPLFVYKDTARGTIWNMSPVGESFVISLSGSGAQEFQMDGNGNAEFQGDVTANGVVLDSSRTLKTDFSPVDGETVLAKLQRLDVSQWRYKDEPASERHIGPMAEDFRQVFGLGDGRHIELVDTTGITMAAIKALEAKNKEKAERIAELEDRIERLENHITR